MKLTPKIQQAINLVSRLHAGQVRKGDDNLPYISHPNSVAWILSNYTNDEDIIVSGLLHDVLEDVKGYYYDDMVRDFGEKIAQIVKGVSEDKVKTEYLEYLTSPLSESKEKKIAFLKFNKIRKDILSKYKEEYDELKDFIKKLKEGK
jgi:(p)ppGpp synthase/HD superfamily hydrolase